MNTSAATNSARQEGNFSSGRKVRAAFSLVELLVIIAVVTIFGGMAFTYVGGASESSGLLVARQQQVQMQTALDAWISAASSGTAGLGAAKAAYTTNASTMMTALGPYLREPGIFSTSGGSISSQALAKIRKTLYFSDWAEGGYPKVLMQ